VALLGIQGFEVNLVAMSQTKAYFSLAQVTLTLSVNHEIRVITLIEKR
jgi:hypothetical protein